MNSLNIIFSGKNEVKVLSEPLPELQDGQILVRTGKSLISTGTECTCLSRNFASGTHWDNWVKYPFYPGYSNVGEVIAIADNVADFKIGDRVTTIAGHQQHYVHDAKRAVKVPDGVSDEAATWTILSATVQNGVRRAKHALGEDIVIIGAGLLGQLAVQFVRLMGARSVICIDMVSHRLEMAKSHGATHTLNMSVANARESIFEITDGRGADVVYDITGHPKVLSEALPLLRKFGKLVIIGDAGSPSDQHITKDVINNGLQIIGAHGFNPPEVATDENRWTRKNMSILFLHFLERGKMQVDDLITHHFTPQEASRAYDMLLQDRHKAMGVLFNWDNLDEL